MLKIHRDWTTWVILGAIIVLMGVMLATAQGEPAQATITVTTQVDEINSNGQCSLREAIRAANTNAAVDSCTAGVGADLIIVPTGTYTLTIAGINEEAALTGDLDITESVEIQGQSAALTIINANGLDRIFDVRGGNRILLSDMTVREGATQGGIRTDAPTTLTRMTVMNNYFGVRSTEALTIVNSQILSNTNVPLPPRGARGVGLYTEGPTLIRNSTIANNFALADDSDEALGIGWFHQSGSALMENSTVSNNNVESLLSPVGPNVVLAVYGVVPITMRYTTIGSHYISNISPQPGSGLGAMLNGVDLYASVVESNEDTEEVQICGVGGFPAVTVTSSGYNSLSDGSCALTGTGDANNASDLNLGALGDNGGDAPTHLPGAGSSLLDTAPLAQCPTEDQRGVARPQDGDGNGTGECDRGAVEVGDGPAEPTATPTASPTGSPTPTTPPTQTPQPTFTPQATYTALPTYTPQVTFTPLASATATGTASGDESRLFLPLLHKAGD